LLELRLRDLVERLDSLDESLSVFARKGAPLDEDSRLYLDRIPDDVDRLEVDGVTNVIDVWRIKDVVEGKARAAGLDCPDTDRKVQLLVEFFRNGA
jgi:hypothetical protein